MEAAKTEVGGEHRLRDFVDATVRSPLFYVQVIGAAAIDQVGDFPKEWDGGEGFGRRTGSRLAQAFASDAIGHTVAAVIKHRVLYDACTCRGLSRVGHALGRAFVSVRSDGGLAPNISLWMAKYASAGLANAWYPRSYHGTDVVVQGSLGIAATAGLNVVQEFTPELLRLLPGR